MMKNFKAADTCFHLSYTWIGDVVTVLKQADTFSQHITSLGFDSLSQYIVVCPSNCGTPLHKIHHNYTMLIPTLPAEGWSRTFLGGGN